MTSFERIEYAARKEELIEREQGVRTDFESSVKRFIKVKLPDPPGILYNGVNLYLWSQARWGDGSYYFDTNNLGKNKES